MTGPTFDLNRFFYKLRTSCLLWVPVVILVIALVNAAGFLLPAKYEAKATVRIYEAQLRQINANAGEVLSIQDRLKTIRNEMQSTPFLSEVAHNVNLDAGIAPESEAHQKLIKKMADSLTLYVRNLDLFEISYVGPDPQMVYDVTNEIVKVYQRRSGQYYEGKTRRNVDFISEQLESAKRRLATAQDNVRNYKEAHIKEIPEAEKEHTAQLIQLRNDLQIYRQDLNANQDGLRMLTRRLAEVDKDIISETQTEASQEMADLKRKKKGLELQLDILLHDFTEDHWQVKETQTQLHMIEEQIRSEEENQTSKVTTAPNPQHQLLQEQIDLTEFNISKLQGQIAKAETDIQQREGYMSKILSRALELERLEDEHSQAKDQVDMLSKRLQEAKLTAELERGGQGPTFDPMDPPQLPRKPVSPNRKKVAAASVVLGFGAGGALIFLLTILDASLRTMEEARRVLRMPVLGVVQRIVSAREEMRQRRRRRWAMVSIGSGIVLVIVALIIGLTVYREPLQEQIKTLLRLMGQS